MKNLYELLKKYVPENAVHYCYDLWADHPFSFRVTRTRNSKLGDYRYVYATQSHTITINHDLNPYSFLLTYVHEYAHLITQLEYGGKVAPHGKEWKKNFRKLMEPLLNNMVYPDEILILLKMHMRNPKASSCSDPKLAIALNHRKSELSNGLYLQDLNPGDQFLLKQRIFEMEQKRRTRFICRELKTGKKYLIPQIALVKPMS